MTNALSLTLTDVRSASRHMLVDKRAVLDSVTGIAALVGVTERTFGKLEALPAEVLKLLNANELRTLDQVHDGWGSAIWHVCEGVLAAPTASAAAKEAARWTLDNFVPSKSELRATYVLEASRARDREVKLTEGRAKLESIPTVDGGTLHTWAVAFIEAGKGLDPLLHDRAEGRVDRSDASKLRGQMIGQIARLREVIGEVLEETPDQGAAVLKSLFGYYDMLVEMRSKGSQEPTPTPPAA